MAAIDAAVPVIVMTPTARSTPRGRFARRRLRLPRQATRAGADPAPVAARAACTGEWRRGGHVRHRHAATAPVRELVGQSAAAQELFKRIVLLADNDLSVLIQGESGVGKELVARAIHRRASARRSRSSRSTARRFRAVDGVRAVRHERGAFTDAKQARPGRSSWPAQAPCSSTRSRPAAAAAEQVAARPAGAQLRARRRHDPLAFRARLVCATNQDLAAAVTAGRFREDLYHRINLVTLTVPPLRERRRHPRAGAVVAARGQPRGGQVHHRGRAGVLDRLRAHDWPATCANSNT